MNQKKILSKTEDETPQKPPNVFCCWSSWEILLLVSMDGHVWIVHLNMFPDEQGEFLHLPAEPFLFSYGFVPLSAGGGDEAPNYPGQAPLTKEGACAGHATTEPESQGHRLGQELGVHRKCVLHGERNFSPSSISVIDMLMKNSGVRC